jgi:hypothetical protein
MTLACTHTYIYTCMYIYIYIYIYIHKHTHADAHIYTYTLTLGRNTWQVQAAQMKYMLPRLQYFMTQGAGMDAKGGGKGLKGVSFVYNLSHVCVCRAYVSVCMIVN